MPRNRSVPSGFAVTFFAAFVGVLVNVLILYFAPFVKETGVPFSYPSWMSFLIGALLLRHQFRIFFLDYAVPDDINRDRLRTSVILLFPLALLGSVILTLFSFDVLYGVPIVAAYNILFLYFWSHLYRGLPEPPQQPSLPTGDVSTEKKNRVKTAVGFFGDLASLGFWGWSFWCFFVGIDLSDTGIHSLFGLTLVFIALEIGILYGHNIVYRFDLIYKILTGRANPLTDYYVISQCPKDCPYVEVDNEHEFKDRFFSDS